MTLPLQAPPPPGVPVTLTADQARELAARELAKAAYRAEEPGLLDRAVRWVLERLGDLLTLLTATRLGGAGGVVVVLVLVVVLAVVARAVLGRVGRDARARAAALDTGGLTADDHRRLAAGHAERGEYDEAVRAWMRAVVAGLEERDLLVARVGRTAGEVVGEVTTTLPAAAGAVRAAARCFDETVYGGRAADAATVETMREADGTVRATRPVPTGSAAG